MTPSTRARRRHISFLLPTILTYLGQQNKPLWETVRKRLKQSEPISLMREKWVNVLYTFTRGSHIQSFICFDHPSTFPKIDVICKAPHFFLCCTFLPVFQWIYCSVLLLHMFDISKCSTGLHSNVVVQYLRRFTVP